MHALRVDHAELVRDVVLGRQSECELLEGRIQLGVAQHLAQGLNQCWRQGLHGAQVGIAAQGLHGALQHQALAGFPAVEGVAVVGQQAHERVGVQAVVQHHRGAESPQQRGHGFAVHIHKGEMGNVLAQHHGALQGAVFAACQLQGQGVTITRQQAQRDRDHERFFAALAWGGGAGLRQAQRVAALGGVVDATRFQARRARLAVPALELAQVLGQRCAGVGVGDGLGKVVAGHGLTVVACKVQLHAFGEAFTAMQVSGAGHERLHHANDF